jgi:hypothetical protein
LTKVKHEPSLYILDFDCSGRPARMRVSTSPILSNRIKMTLVDVNPNFGKADDYGSERFSVINQCMIAKAKSMDLCMAKKGYVFCPDCQVLGNDGPKCKSDEVNRLRSWCYEQGIPKALEVMKQ